MIENRYSQKLHIVLPITISRYRSIYRLIFCSYSSYYYIIWSLARDGFICPGFIEINQGPGYQCFLRLLKLAWSFYSGKIRWNTSSCTSLLNITYLHFFIALLWSLDSSSIFQEKRCHRLLYWIQKRRCIQSNLFLYI